MWCPGVVPVTLALVALALAAKLTLRRPRPSPTTVSTVRDGKRRSRGGGGVNDSGETNETAGRPWFMRGGARWPQPDENINKLFPEDAPGEDRIVEQLMYALPTHEEVPIKMILLANGLGAWDARPGRAEFTRLARRRRRRCPVHRCALTDDERHAATADAILFKDYYVSFNVKRPPNQIWILYYLESPWHTPPVPARAAGQINWTATYRRDSDLVAPAGRWAYHDPRVTQRELTRNYAANKTKKVAWFVSNCEARNGRHEFALELARHIPVDVYGACGALRCSRHDPACWRMLDRDYKFYLAFENSNCQDYITEKLFENGLRHDVLPIVMGARVTEYQAAAPRRSLVHVEQFPGAAELAAHLRTLDQNDELYNSYFKWKGTGEFINTYFFCRLCALLHARDRRRRARHHADVRAWWRDHACTRARWTSDDNTTSTLSAGGASSIINIVKKIFS